MIDSAIIPIRDTELSDLDVTSGQNLRRPNFDRNSISLLFSQLPRPIGKLQDAVHYIGETLAEGSSLELITDCTNGTYRLYNQWSEPEAIFKPMDEESLAENNPKGFSCNRSLSSPLSAASPSLRNHSMVSHNSNSRVAQLLSFCPVHRRDQPSVATSSSGLLASSLQLGFERGISPGTSAYRELISYLLDKNGVAGVPETAMVTVRSPGFWVDGQVSEVSVSKTGSLQLYVRNKGSSEDYGQSNFEVQNVQGVALLDMRILNLDRHGNNLLATLKQRYESDHAEDDNRLGDWQISLSSQKCIRRSQSMYSDHYSSRCISIVPIDHGLCLPEISCAIRPEWCWMGWPQCKIPFTPYLQSVVKNLDSTHDEETIIQVWPFVPMNVLFTLRLCTFWIKLGVSMGLSVSDLASFYIDPYLPDTIIPSGTNEFGSKLASDLNLSFFQHIAHLFLNSLPQLLNKNQFFSPKLEYSSAFDDFLVHVAKPLMVKFIHCLQAMTDNTK